MKPLVSLVIPLFNAENEIRICLNSIFKSSWPHFEVIIIDDCSTDRSLDVAKEYPCRIYTMDSNRGPAKARNLGVSQADSEIILFLDSDTQVKEATIKQFYDAFQKHRDIDAVLAVPESASLRAGRASNYNSLRSHYTFISAEPITDYFSTQMGAMRKDAFLATGGFDEKFTSADIEDIELGMRLRPNRVLIQKEILIGHHFPQFSSIMKKYVRRACLFSLLLRERKKLALTGVHTNRSGMLSVCLVLLSALFLSLACLGTIISPECFTLFFTVYGISSILFMVMKLDLFLFCTREKGVVYLIEAAFFEYVFSLAIGLGGIVSWL